MDVEKTNVLGDNAVNGRDSGTVETTLSAGEFQRLQEQLLELRNRNYELIEENKRQQNYINVLPSKSNDTLNFASKVISQCEYLEKQLKEKESEQKSSPTNGIYVISQCEYLEKQLKEKESEQKSSPTNDPSNAEGVKGCVDRSDDLKKEICHLKDIIAEKDALISEIEKLKEDLIAAKRNYDEQIAETKKQLVDVSTRLQDSRRCNEDLETSLRTKNEEIALLNASVRDAQQRAESSEADRALIQSLHKEVEEMRAQRDEWAKTRNEETAKSSQLTDEVATLRASLQHSEINWKKSFDKLRSERDELINEKEELLKTATSVESMGRELEECHTQLNELREKLQQTNAALDTANRAKEELLAQLAELQRSLQVAIDEKEMAVRSNEENSKLLNEQLFAKQQKLEELARTNEAEIFVVTSELKSANSDLEMKIKENEEKLKAKDQEMKIALKKQSSMVRELRRQVLQEKKRAEQAERQLDEVLGSIIYGGGGRHFRVGGSPSNSDHARGSAEPASSVCSWAFIADSDANSVHTLDGEESSCSASVLESDNAELIAKLALLQKKHSETIDHLNMLEEENVLLRKGISEKNELIAEWIRSRPLAGDLQSSSASPSMRLRRVFDMVRVDESAADIRDMNRRLQRMLEETLSKNLLLQKDIELLLEKKDGK
uniref:GRIP domain-containing protein n=1 Tax=Ascaris lumbricoides TaxID=6252 RepID=A0A0M3HX08_ASCLU